MNKQRVAISWSGGKDSMLVLHQLLQDPTCEVVGLLTNINRETAMVKTHFVPEEIIRKQGEALNLPILPVRMAANADNEEFKQETQKALQAAGVDTVAFGDIFLEDIKAFREQSCREAGVEATFPLWGQSAKEVSQEFFNRGYSAIIVSIEGGMDEGFLGHNYDSHLLTLLPDGTDEAGEQGHFHTLVIDGPVFQKPLDVVINGKRKATLKGAAMNKFLYCTFKT